PDNLEELKKMTGNDKGQLSRVLQQFIEETEKDNARLLTNIQANNMQHAADSLHRMAGRIGQVGMKTVAQQLRTAEIQIRNNGNEDMSVCLLQLHREVATAIATVKGYIAA